MARQQHDREDLIREAVALTVRVEWMCPEASELCVLGFRPSGAASLFVGQDPVYHFNSALELRRAYQQGHLYKSEAGRLVRMTRSLDGQRPILHSKTLSAEEQQAFLDALTRRLAVTRATFSRPPAEAPVTRAVPDPETGLRTIDHWLSQLPDAIVIAKRPHVA